MQQIAKKPRKELTGNKIWSIKSKYGGKNIVRQGLSIKKTNRIY